jgi:hypothetical protein
MRMLPILLVCPFMAGCLAFAAPRVNVTPAVVARDSDVHAFHVTERTTFFGLINVPKGLVTVEEIPIEHGVIPRRRDCFVSHFVFVCIVAHWHDQTDSIRLYRRGYETVVIPANRLFKAIGDWTPVEVTWRKAETLKAREEAINEIHRSLDCIGIISGGQNQFIASEYAALAESKLAADVDLAPQRLHGMAEKFRKGIPPDDLFRRD